ncbi:MAG: TIGR02147 family protein [Oligoflexales bacterium]
MTTIQHPTYRYLLEKELADRIKKNPRYSLRAFAKSLNVDVGNLSRCLNGKANVSLKTAQHLADALALSPNVRNQFLNSLIAQKAGTHEGTKATLTEIENLEVEAFSTIADPLHYAIMELTFVEGFKNDIEWIAKSLGATKVEVKTAIQRLQMLNLVEEIDGKLVKKAQSTLRTPSGLNTSAALRQHQKAVLQKSSFALENTSIQKRCHASMTLPIDEKDLEEVRARIDQFTLELCKTYSKGTKTKVYQLHVGFFPLQEEA